TWLHRITVNTWKNRVRYEKRRFHYNHFSLSANEDGEEGRPALDPADPSMSPEERAQQRDEHGRILSALETLDPDERSLIVLRDMEERSYDEMAGILEMNMG